MDGYAFNNFFPLQGCWRLAGGAAHLSTVTLYHAQVAVQTRPMLKHHEIQDGRPSMPLAGILNSI
jgi:hypothetical protein